VPYFTTGGRYKTAELKRAKKCERKNVYSAEPMAELKPHLGAMRFECEHPAHYQEQSHEV
jgi:hypothetical protein